MPLTGLLFSGIMGMMRGNGAYRAKLLRRGVVLFALLLCGCGGGGKNPVVGGSDGQPSSLVRLSCQHSGLFPGNSTVCRALVDQQDTSGLAYSWQSSCGGQFEGDGTDTVTFTAPETEAAQDCQLDVTVSSATQAPVTASRTLKLSPGRTISDDRFVVVSDEEAAPLEYVSSDGQGTFTFKVKDPKLRERKGKVVTEGDFIVGTQDNGYIRQVLSASDDGETVTVQTVEAALTDIVEEGTFQGEVDMSDAVLTQGKGKVSFSNGTLVFEDQVIYDKTPAKVTITKGTVKFGPKFDIGGKLSGFSLDELHVKAGGQLDADLEVKVSGRVKEELRQTVARVDKPFFFTLGPVPVVGVVSLIFDAGVRVEVEAGSLTVPTTTSASVNVGAQYTSASGWAPVKEGSFDFAMGEPTIDVEASAKLHAFVEPRAEVMFYAVLGPELNVHPYGELRGSYTQPDDCHFLAWEAAAGITSDFIIKAQIPVLDKKLPLYTKRLFEYEQVLKNGSWKQCPVSTLAITPSSIELEEGETVQFKAVATFTDGAREEVTDRASWTSSNTAVGTISAGLFTSLSAGSTSVSASYKDVASNQATVTVSERPANYAPVITALSADPDTVKPGETTALTCDAMDKDGDTLAYSWTADGGTISGSGPKVTWTAPQTASNYTLTCEVSDGQQAAKETLILTVSQPNQPPTASLLADKETGTLPLTVTFSVSCSDPEGLCATYTLDPGDGSAPYTGSILSGAAVEKSHTYQTSGSYSAKLTVTDQEGASASATLSISVAGIGVNIASSVATGLFHSCAITSANGVKCWGENTYGQLGNGKIESSVVPSDVVGLSSGVKMVEAGFSHTCALLEDGSVRCWGRNHKGQLGNGSTADSSSPVAASVSGVVMITAGGDTTCALLGDGQISCWGNEYGASPATVSGVSGAVQVTAGEAHVCALLDDGSVKCWGKNATKGQLGNGSTEGSTTPVTVSGLSGASYLASGDNHVCAIVSGSVYCWGYNGTGQIGGSLTIHTTPVQVSGLSSITVVTGGGGHTCASDGRTTYCLGLNTSGQLGDGSTTTTPKDTVVVQGAVGATALSAGGYHTCAALGSGSVECWGRNGQGQVGDGTTENRTTPVPVIGFTVSRWMEGIRDLFARITLLTRG